MISSASISSDGTYPDWGYITDVIKTPGYKVSLLTVKANCSIPNTSNQSIFKTWRILEGVPLNFQIGNIPVTFNCLKTYDILPGISHGISAQSQLLILEVQWGYINE